MKELAFALLFMLIVFVVALAFANGSIPCVLCG